MIHIQVNLKRFDVSRARGGIRPGDDPVEWIAETMKQVVHEVAGSDAEVEYTFYPPEALLPAAIRTLRELEAEARVHVGTQGVHWEDIVKGGNFGAFTTSLPASAALEYGATSALVGHSEERAKLTALGSSFMRDLAQEGDSQAALPLVVNETVAKSARLALDRGLKVTLCVGETAEERGGEPVDFERVHRVLENQVAALGNVSNAQNLLIAYEPRWAIGPGKTPPGPEYIDKVASYLKSLCRDLFGEPLPILYGGGLKRENGGSIGSISSVDGGLIALTKFTPPIGFDAREMRVIVDKFVEGSKGVEV